MSSFPDSYSNGGDRVGIGWRPELGRDILEQIGEIDILEVVAESCLKMTASELRSIGRLSEHTALVVHALSLGLISTYPVEQGRLEGIARVVHGIAPESWSEHLAFVRTPKYEIGHLAAPPWSEETISSGLKNIKTATEAVGAPPHLENIATLYLPMGSTMTESEWTAAIIRQAGVGLLLDVENVYANSRNFKVDPFELLHSFPLDTVRYIHIAGGVEKEDSAGDFFLDDHLHPVSKAVFDLLEEIAASTPAPLTVILERDGHYPAYEELAAELQLARKALARGRARRETINAAERC